MTNADLDAMFEAGENSVAADWDFAFTEILDWPDDTPVSPTVVANHIKELTEAKEAADAERDQLRQQYEHDRGTVRAAVNAAEAAEAKLAVAVECLEFYARKNVTYPGVGTVEFCGHDDNGEIARATLAQMKGTEDG